MRNCWCADYIFQDRTKNNLTTFFNNTGKTTELLLMIWETSLKYQSNQIWKLKSCQIVALYVFFMDSVHRKLIFQIFRLLIVVLFKFLLAKNMSYLSCIYIHIFNILSKQFWNETRWLFVRFVHNTSWKWELHM